MLNEAQEGVKGGTLAGGSPFAGGLSRPQLLRFTDARSNPAPGGGGTPPLQRFQALPTYLIPAASLP